MFNYLQEVIVGRVDGACVPKLTTEIKAYANNRDWTFYQEHGGKSFPRELVNQAELEIEELCRVLEHEGVTVRRPEPVDYSVEYKTPDFHSPSGLYSAMPR